MLDYVVPHVVQDLIGVQVDPVQQPVDPVRTAIPASSASAQPFFRSSGAISPRTYANAASRGSDLEKRCTNRSCKSQKAPIAVDTVFGSVGRR